MASPARGKRGFDEVQPYEDDAQPTEPKRAKKEAIIKTMQLQLFDQYEFTAKNVLSLNATNFKQLFPNSEFSTDYVRIADRVYLAEIGNPKAGSLYMNGIQDDEIVSRGDPKAPTVALTPYDPEAEGVRDLKSVIVDVERYHDDDEDQDIVFELEEIESSVRQFLATQVVTRGQTFLVDNAKCALKITVSDFETETDADMMEEDDYIAPSRRFGYIGNETMVDFDYSSYSKLSIVSPLLNVKPRRCRFSATLIENPGRKGQMLTFSDDEDEDSNVVILKSQTRGTRKSTVLDLGLLSKKVREATKDCFIYTGYTTKFDFNRDWQVKLKLDDVELPGGITNTASERERQYQEAMKLDKNTSLEFVAMSRDVIFSEGKPVKCKECHISIIEVIDPPKDAVTNQMVSPWVSVQEIKDKLKKLKKGLVIGQCIDLKLTTGIFTLKLTEVGEVNTKKAHRAWSIGQDTEIKFNVESSQRVQLVADANPLDIKKLNVKVTPKGSAGGGGMNIFSMMFGGGKDAAPPKIEFKEEEVEKAIRSSLTGSLVRKQNFQIPCGNKILNVKLKNLIFDKVKAKDDPVENLGRIVKETKIDFKTKPEDELVFTKKAPEFDSKDLGKTLREMGVGGLTAEFTKIFESIIRSRQARFKTRNDKLGIQPIKGLLLSGPPGTGKTTLARNFAKLLNVPDERFTLIVGTEVESKWVGESEKNIRNLFAPARDAQDKNPDSPDLYVIVIDEIDAIGSKRSGDNQPYHNKVVNQLLGSIDGGKDPLRNVVIVGITNHIDLLDPALVRSGRLGVQIEIKAPDEKGRKEIFDIYTKKMRDIGILADDVKTEDLASLTPELTGADIEQICQAASKDAEGRLAELDPMMDDDVFDAHPAGKINMKDFKKAVMEFKVNKKIGSNEAPFGMYS